MQCEVDDGKVEGGRGRSEKRIKKGTYSKQHKRTKTDEKEKAVRGRESKNRKRE